MESGTINGTKGEAQARGSAEKRFDDFQRRLPFLCEKYRVQALPAANRILADEVAYDHERRVHLETGEIPLLRWQCGLAEGRGRLHPPPTHLDLPLVCSLHSERTLRKDGTLRFVGQT